MVVRQRRYIVEYTGEEKQNLYCGASRNWPRSLVLSIAGDKKKNNQDGRKGIGKFFWHQRKTRTVVMQELFDEVYMGEDHTPTAVSFEL